jgi:hypothetical protein
MSMSEFQNKDSDIAWKVDWNSDVGRAMRPAVDVTGGGLIYNDLCEPLQRR